MPKVSPLFSPSPVRTRFAPSRFTPLPFAPAPAFRRQIPPPGRVPKTLFLTCTATACCTTPLQPPSNSSPTVARNDMAGGWRGVGGGLEGHAGRYMEISMLQNVVSGTLHRYCRRRRSPWPWMAEAPEAEESFQQCARFRPTSE